MKLDDINTTLILHTMLAIGWFGVKCFLAGYVICAVMVWTVLLFAPIEWIDGALQWLRFAR